MNDSHVTAAVVQRRPGNQVCKKSAGVVLGSLSYSKENITHCYYHFLLIFFFSPNALNLCEVMAKAGENVKSFLTVSPAMLLRSTEHFMSSLCWCQ